MSYYGINNDEIIQNTLQELCMAQYAENYCLSCASGSGCCAAAPSNDIPHDEDCEAEMIEYQEEEDAVKENFNGDSKVRRRTLTIDLSKDEDLSDGEILKRLLSPLESPLSDEPLEVILEIVDEEDNDDDVELPTSKTFRSLREKLKKITSCKPSRETRSTSLYWKRQLRKIKQDLDSSCNDFDDNNAGRYSSLEMCPSYHKANNLINEIEKCFMETANLVEKTLESSKTQGVLEPCIANGISTKNSLDTKHFTSSMEEALHVFDSLLSDNRAIRKTDPKYNDTYSDNTKIAYNNAHNYNNSNSNNHYNQQNIEGITNENENWYQRALTLQGGASFEKDIDELFKECYELTSIEPSTSLGSCLKNLESLCIQLNRIKENILMEMKSEYRCGLNNDNFDCYGSHASSLDSQECLSVINELIDRKLKEKLKKTKFSLDPPLMGLEGKTHKKIAEVLPSKSNLENATYFNRENDISQTYFRDNNDKIYNPNITIDTVYEGSFDQVEFNSESTSEISTTTNTLNSSRCFSSSSNSGNYKNEDMNKYSGSSEDGESIAMSYEETLALYEDNQELQKSLLSILHSLNDIHDNFLNRRRVEMALSQQNSDFIQNHLKSEIFSSNQRSADPNVTLRTEILANTTNFSTNVLQNQFEKEFSVKKTDDFESIEKIIRVSDELKNLWLYGTKDLELKPRKPSRTVSFNRGVKRYKQFSDYYEESLSDDYSYLDSTHGKSLSLPNLSAMNNENYEASSTASTTSSLNSPTSPNNQRIHETQSQNFFVDNFVKHMKDENNKSYEVTLNFLQRIMETSKIIDDENCARKNFSPQAGQNENYNAFQRTY